MPYWIEIVSARLVYEDVPDDAVDHSAFGNTAEMYWGVTVFCSYVRGWPPAGDWPSVQSTHPVTSHLSSTCHCRHQFVVELWMGQSGKNEVDYRWDILCPYWAYAWSFTSFQTTRFSFSWHLINHLKAKTVTKSCALYHALCTVAIKECLCSDLFLNYAVPVTQVILRRKRNTMPLNVALEQIGKK